MSGGWILGLSRLVVDKVAVQQVAHLKDLLGTRCGELQLLSQRRQELLLLRSHDPIAVDQLAGQGEGHLLLLRAEQRGRAGDQPLPRLLPEALEQARDQQAESVGLHRLVGRPPQQLLPDHPGFVLAEGLIAAHRRQGDGGKGFKRGHREAHGGGSERTSSGCRQFWWRSLRIGQAQGTRTLLFIVLIQGAVHTLTPKIVHQQVTDFPIHRRSEMLLPIEEVDHLPW